MFPPSTLEQPATAVSTACAIALRVVELREMVVAAKPPPLRSASSPGRAGREPRPRKTRAPASGARAPPPSRGRIRCFQPHRRLHRHAAAYHDSLYCLRICPCICPCCLRAGSAGDSEPQRRGQASNDRRWYLRRRPTVPPGAKPRSAAYNAAEGQLLNVAAKAKRTQGTVGGSGNIAVPAFSIVSISAAE